MLVFNRKHTQKIAAAIIIVVVMTMVVTMVLPYIA